MLLRVERNWAEFDKVEKYGGFKWELTFNVDLDSTIISDQWRCIIGDISRLQPFDDKYNVVFIKLKLLRAK